MTHACLGFVVWPAPQEKGGRPRDGGTAKSAVRDAPAQRRTIGVRKRLQLPSAIMHACKAPETPRELPLDETVMTCNINYLIGGGEGGIRTHGTVTRTTVFETALRRAWSKGEAKDRGDWRLSLSLENRMIKVQITLVAGP